MTLKDLLFLIFKSLWQKEIPKLYLLTATEGWLCSLSNVYIETQISGEPHHLFM